MTEPVSMVHLSGERVATKERTAAPRIGLAKRAGDLGLSLILTVVLAPLIVLVGFAVLIADGRPVFFVSERMKTPSVPFMLWKFRTMKPGQADNRVCGGHKAHRITRLGRFLRRSRLDELPQLWNVIRGDISFVGPRPPVRYYVEMFPHLYERVLAVRPGITGLATLAFHRHEERMLARCRTAAETDATYVRRCVPRKARLDLIYAENRCFAFDVRLMFATIIRKLPLHSRRRSGFPSLPPALKRARSRRRSLSAVGRADLG